MLKEALEYLSQLTAQAAKVQDLRDWIDQRKLVELWPRIWLPVQLRDLWESRFPELSARRAAMALAV